MTPPGYWDLPVIENADTVWPILLPITTATTTGYSAKVEIRTQDDPESTRLLLLTSNPSAGLTLSISDGKLLVTLTITEAQADVLAPLVLRTGDAAWSLKIVYPGGSSVQWLKGSVTVTRTTTT